MLNILFIATFAILCLASVGAWRRLIAKIQAGQIIIPRRRPAPSAIGLVDVGIMFATWLLGQFGALVWSHGLGNVQTPKLAGDALANLIGVSAVCQILSTATGLTLVGMRNRSLVPIGFSFVHWRFDFGLGMKAFLLTVPPLLVLQFLLSKIIPYEHATLSALEHHPTFSMLLSVWLAAVLVAPICEEIFFRGVLQFWFERWKKKGIALDELILGGNPQSKPVNRVSPPRPLENEADCSGAVNSDALKVKQSDTMVDKIYPFDTSQVFSSRAGLGSEEEFTQLADEHFSVGMWPIIVSALVFSLVHIGQGLAPIPLFIMGLVLGYLFAKTRSLVSCVVLHAGLNGFSMFWFTVGVLTQDVSDVPGVVQ